MLYVLTKDVLSLTGKGRRFSFVMHFEILPQGRHFTSLLSLTRKDFRKEVSQFDGIIFLLQYCKQVVSMEAQEDHIELSILSFQLLKFWRSIF